MKKAKAEKFIDYVQNALILGASERGGGARSGSPLASLFHELEQASRASLYIPESLSADDAAREFVRFIFANESRSSIEAVPGWIQQFLSRESDGIATRWRDF